MHAGEGIELVDLPCAVTCGCGVDLPTGGQAAFDSRRRVVFCLWCLADQEAGRTIPQQRRPQSPAVRAPQPQTTAVWAPEPLALEPQAHDSPLHEPQALEPQAMEVSAPPPALPPDHPPTPVAAPARPQDTRGGRPMLAAVLVAAVLCVAVLGLHTYLGSNAGGIRAWGAGGTGGQGAGGSTVVQGDVRVGGATAASRTGVDWPPVPADAQTSPIALPPVQQSGSTDYAFIEVVSDTFGPPVRWDPCRPIHVVVNTATAPPGADALLREALAEVSADTGLRFTIEGTTTERPASGRGSVETARYGDRWAPVLVAWTDPSAVPTLQGPVVGLGGPAEASYVDRKDRHYVSGIVYLDGPAFRDILRDPDGRDEARAIVMHEFGHLVGLAHVDTSTELMFSRNIGQVTFGEGDREGLRRLGDGPCFSQ